MKKSHNGRVHISDIEKGDVFYECDMGHNIELTALEDAHEATRQGSKGYVCKTQITNGEELELFENLQPGAYGLNLYTYPQYPENL